MEGNQRGVVVAELTQLTVAYRGAVIHGDVVTVTAALQPEEENHMVSLCHTVVRALWPLYHFLQQ